MLYTNGREQAQGLFATRGNERGKDKGGKFKSKPRPLMERSCYKRRELGHFKANCLKKIARVYSLRSYLQEIFDLFDLLNN